MAKSYHDAASARQRAFGLLTLFPIAIATVVYLPILRVYFFADDFACLASLRDGNLLYFLIRPFGGHTSLVRNAVFAISYWAFGLQPMLYYATVLVTHAVNVWLLFRVLRNLTTSS